MNNRSQILSIYSFFCSPKIFFELSIHLEKIKVEKKSNARIILSDSFNFEIFQFKILDVFFASSSQEFKKYSLQIFLQISKIS